MPGGKPIYALEPVQHLYFGLYNRQAYNSMFEASPFVVIFQYAFIAAFPLVGLAVVTKWVFDDWKKSRRTQES